MPDTPNTHEIDGCGYCATCRIVIQPAPSNVAPYQCPDCNGLTWSLDYLLDESEAHTPRSHQ